MPQIKNKKNQTFDCSLDYTKAKGIEDKLGVSIFAIAEDSSQGFLQSVWFNPMKAYAILKELLQIAEDELADFDVDDVYTFIEEVVVDFFPKRIQSLVKKMFKEIQRMADQEE